MKPIHFRGQNYDPQKLASLAGQGHRQVIATQDIIALVAVASIGVRIAVQVEGKYHLLTGALDTASQAQELYVLSKHVLKKALEQTTTYQERTAPRQEEPRPRYGRPTPPERQRFGGQMDQLRGWGSSR